MTVIRTMKKRYPEMGKLNKKQVQRIVKRFEAKGSIEDNRHKNTGRPRSVRSDETIEQVKSVIGETPQRSVRRVLGDITNSASSTSVFRMLKYDLKLTPYTISIMQHLKPTDITSRLSFARWMVANIHIVDNIWFSDEAHFFLNAQVNKKNCRYWGTEKPHYYIEKSLHAEKVTVWAALSADGIIGPFFFEDDEGNVDTVNKGRYLNVLKKKFLPALRRKGIDVDTIWFQQDGAAPHTAIDVITWLQQTFGRNLISLKTDCEWPPHSPDLSPLDFFLWGHLKDKVYKPTPTTTDELKAAIKREIRVISSETCTAVIRNFQQRLDVVISEKGRHLEHIL